MKKNKKYLTKKPSVFFYGIFRIVSLIASKFLFNLKVIRNEIKNKKGAYVVIANHESSIDFINLCACNRNRMHFVISNSFYQSLPVNPALKAAGVIPKQQFQTAMEDLKKMKAVLDNNMPLVIYPAGLMSEDGIATPIPKGTGKLLRWFNVDVYVAKTTGSYFTNPKWGKCGFRKGRITLDIYKLYDKGELTSYNEKDIQNTIESLLDYNSYEYQEKELVKYKKGDNVEGLENVLYKCPKCNKEFFMKSDGNKLFCTSCNNLAIADKYGLLHQGNEESVIYKKVCDWSSFIKNDLYKEIEEDLYYKMVGHGKIAMINSKKHKFEEVGEADITLERSVFKLKGTLNNEEFNKEISIKEIFLFPFSPGRHFEIQDGKTIYRIYLDNGVEATKWMNALRIIYQMNHSESLITQ